MTRYRRPRARSSAISDVEWALLTDQAVPDPDSPASKWAAYALVYSVEGVVRRTLRQSWEENRDEVLAVWIAERPGTRPSCWWQWEAPEPLDGGESECDYLERYGLLSEVERRTMNNAV